GSSIRRRWRNSSSSIIQAAAPGSAWRWIGKRQICRARLAPIEGKLMSTRIADYYNELQRREGLEPVQLIADWNPQDADAISAAFRTAVATSRITEQGIPIRAVSTNQSIG